MTKKIKTLYFSATGTTEKIVTGIAKEIAERYANGAKVSAIDFTLPHARKKPVSFDKDTIVIVGTPVYAGRVPNLLLTFLNTISGNGATAVAVVLYGNRNYDDALIELNDILDTTGFHVIAGGAFVGEHSFSSTLGAHRPDDHDMKLMADFATKIIEKLNSPNEKSVLVVKGNKPYHGYYQPKDKDGNPVSILKVTPKTNSDCIDCKICAEVCPMGSIDLDDVTQITGICIKCCACVKKCPVAAKYFDDENYLWHKHELEIDYTDTRREPEYVVAL